ncbi:MAG: 50S ribosomal protein L30 [Acidimicrobiales bacterium]
MGSGDIVVRQVRSAIGSKPRHRGTLRALGLGRIGRSNRLPDRPEIRGMIARVPHLVTVEPAPAEPAPAEQGPEPAPAEQGPEPAPAGSARKERTP